MWAAIRAVRVQRAVLDAAHAIGRHNKLELGRARGGLGSVESNARPGLPPPGCVVDFSLGLIYIFHSSRCRLLRP